MAFKMTAEVYAKMVKTFMDNKDATPAMIATAAGVDRKQVLIALKTGWPELGLPPLGEAVASLAEPAQVHEMMAGLIEQQKKIFENLFGKTPDPPALPAKLTVKQISAQAKKEATVRAAEHGMAARVALSTAGKTAQAVEELADWALHKIANGEVELPEQLRLEHIMMLAKATDISTNAVFKAMQTEKLRNGEPIDIAHQNVLVLLQSASPEQLKHIAQTGNIPQDMMTTNSNGKKIIETTATSK